MTDAAPSPTHLFLVGLPRTGSTLLRHVLNRLPGVAIASETHFMARSRRLRLPERLERARRAADPNLDPIVADVLDPRFWPWLARNVGAVEFTNRLRTTDLTHRGLFDLMLELYSAAAVGDEPLRVRGEKTPAHLADVPLLAAWFPGARFIHTMRDPRGVYASRLRRAQQGVWGLKARMPRVPARLVDPILPPLEASYAAVSWSRAARLDDRYRRELGERYLLVRFEDLVSAPEATLRGVTAFIGTEFVPALLEQADIVGSSFQSERHAGRGFDAGTAERWRHEVSPLMAGLIAGATRPWLRRFGYRP